MQFVYGWAFPDSDRFMVREIAADGTYQRSHVEAALRWVVDWSAALDGGAHVGTWSRLLSPRFGRVLAFEPALDTFVCLGRNMDAQGCHNVECLQRALGSAPGWVDMVMDSAETQRGNTGGRFAREAGNGAVERVTIDSLGLERLGFLKLDVEGAEVDALKGAAATLLRCEPIVLIENKGHERRYGYAKGEAVNWLLQMGYRRLEKVGRDEIFGRAGRHA